MLKIQGSVYNENREPVNILHFPGIGKAKYENQQMIKILRENKISLPENITLITVVDHKNIDNALLIKQLNAMEIPFINPAKDLVVERFENTDKIGLILDALQNVDTEYCLILDGLDVVITNLDDIMDKYLALGKDIIYNATNINYPDVDVETIENRESLGSYKYFNAGCCIGKTSALLDFYNECAIELSGCDVSDKYYHSEHYHVRKAFDRCQDIVGIDNGCKIFQVINTAKHEPPFYDSQNGLIVFKIKKFKVRAKQGEKQDKKREQTEQDQEQPEQEQAQNLKEI